MLKILICLSLSHNEQKKRLFICIYNSKLPCTQGIIRVCITEYVIRIFIPLFSKKKSVGSLHWYFFLLLIWKLSFHFKWARRYRISISWVFSFFKVKGTLLPFWDLVYLFERLNFHLTWKWVSNPTTNYLHIFEPNDV